MRYDTKRSISSWERPFETIRNRRIWNDSNYYVYYNIIKDAHEEGYKLADFFGCSGVANPPKTSSIYGLHNFKKRLGGEYHEFIGEFDLVVNKPLNFVYKLYVSLRKKLRK